MSRHHSLPAFEVLQAIRSTEDGLTDDEANGRLAQFGPNELKEEKGATALGILAPMS